MRTQKREHAVVAALLLVILTAGCAAEVSPLTEEEEEFALQTAAIKNGIYVGFKKGLLELSAGMDCTAAMISPTFAVTAAHCIGFVGNNREGWFPMTVAYFDPDTSTKRLVTSKNETVFAWAIPTWDNPSSGIDYQDDLALIRRSTAWSNTDTSDYLRINGGTSSLSVDDIYPMSVFGRGYFAETGTEVGVLRSAAVSLAGSNKHAMWDKEGTRGVCKGDSGGPYIGITSGWEVIAGVAAGAQLDGRCAENGGTQYAAKTSSRLAWIESKMPAGACTKGTHYTRCF